MLLHRPDLPKSESHYLVGTKSCEVEVKKGKILFNGTELKDFFSDAQANFNQEVCIIKGICMHSNIDLETALKMIRNGQIKQDNIYGRYYSDDSNGVKKSGFILDGKGKGVWQGKHDYKNSGSCDHHWIGEVDKDGEPKGFGIMRIDRGEKGVRKYIGHHENFER
jgi:hypothetical protein